MPNRILIVEDENDINDLLARIFTAAGWRVNQAFSGTEAGLLLERETPDLLLLDRMLPGMSGDELLQKLRGEKDGFLPVLILSAKGTLSDKVGLLRLGADDYITKPFEPEEVIARAEAALRRCGKRPEASGGDVLTAGNLQMYPQARKVLVKGQELTLTVHEFDLLFLLAGNPDKVYSRESLYEQIWQGGYYGENNTVNVHVSNLRKKMRAADPETEYIQTVYGIGFKFGAFSS
jgi:DNA-binding response OmpR family regulator